MYLTGPTAVGKSTFVEKDLTTQPDVIPYFGEVQMEAWAKDQTPGTKYLFIDEENITTRQWSEMEGLLNKPPGILIKNIFYPLSSSHKVIFAGNPLSYGGERKLSPLFERHGNAVLFEPLSCEFIYEKMLKPVFASSRLQSHALALATPLLAAYQFIVQQSQNEVLISPREVQMMALLVASYAERHPDANADECLLAAQHYAYRLGGL